MSKGEQSVAGTARAATACALVMIANQVAGKATRDAVFLSTYDITDLPVMLIVAALLSVCAVLATTQLLTRFGPGRVATPAFGLSAALFIVEWPLITVAREAIAVAVYLHLAVFGAILISGFWSLVNERFDPRTAKRYISWIAGGATLGGLLGGLLAERIAALLSMATMLPLLGIMHLSCAWLVLYIRPIRAEGRKQPAEQAVDKTRSGFRVLVEVPYLRNLAVMVLLGTVSAGLLDYVFKDQAVSFFGSKGEDLMRFFAVFYTALGIATFLVQSLVGRVALERFGLAKTAATLPFAVMAGGAGVLFIPGLAPIAIVRGAEAVLRSSLFRSAYELFYTPISARDRRATKTIIDVGFDRLGDAVGGGLIRGALLVAPQVITSVLLGIAVGLGCLALLVARRLRRGYVKALERSLVSRAGELDLQDVPTDLSDGTVMQTIANVDLRQVLKAGGASDAALSQMVEGVSKWKTPADPTTKGPSAPRVHRLHAPQLDPITTSIVEIRSGDAARVRTALEHNKELSSALVPHVIPLLAWDEVYPQVVRALRSVAPKVTGQLLDALLDPDEEFAIRRRLPRVLRACSSQRCASGLILGLDDKRFEVRFQCGLALAAIHERAPEIPIPRETIEEAALREVEVDRRIWETHRLLDTLEEDESTPFVDEVVQDRANRSLQHVFTILSLILPAEPLRIAFRGLHTDDPVLQGTAFEYLENVLPAAIRAKLWPFQAESSNREKSRKDLLQSLLRSSESIEMRLAALKARVDK